MKLKGIEFVAVVATPGTGKSYLADRYSDFIDVDELRLRCKYCIPEGITREELEKTKGERPFERRENYKELFYSSVMEAVNSGKILLCAPHEEVKMFLFDNKIPYLFVFPKENTRREIKERMIARGNPDSFVTQNDILFDTYIQSNKLEPFASVKYRLKKGEYLADVLRCAGLDFNRLHSKENKK